jgi:hypothetical protein
MGRDRIRYLVFVSGRFRWCPTKAMRAAGFRMINLSAGVDRNGVRVPTQEDQAKAIALNESWDRRLGPYAATGPFARYPRGSVGAGYERALTLRESERRTRGITWSNEQRSRDDWPRAWKWIEPLFGDCDPKTVSPELMLSLRQLVDLRVSPIEAHRVIKVWRALWKKMAVFGFCSLERDPSLVFANSAPAPRQALWTEGEAVRLVKSAWRMGYFGLAALLATAWDSQLSPIDVRRLGARDMRRDPLGVWFELTRAKTGRAAAATLSKRSARMLKAYLEQQGAQPVGAAPIFRNRSGRPYSKDTLGDDFRAVRARVCGPAEDRQIADLRRSGAAEAISGDVSPAKLSSKMANTLSASNRLHKTYAPPQLADARSVDTARISGRAKLREQKLVESVMAPDQECHDALQQKAKSLK